MILSKPITLTLPGLAKKTFTELPVIIIDNAKFKYVRVQMNPFMKLLTLWEGEDYVKVGDYTQAQVEARILELLGDKPEDKLLSLYVQIPAK